jgi:hypothetical protein
MAFILVDKLIKITGSVKDIISLVDKGCKK